MHVSKNRQRRGELISLLALLIALGGCTRYFSGQNLQAGASTPDSSIPLDARPADAPGLLDSALVDINPPELGESDGRHIDLSPDLVGMTDSSVLSFISLSLANEAADGTINISDVTANRALVSTVVGSGYITAQYLTVLGNSDCTTQNYSSTALPTASGVSGYNGTYKVCVRLSDAANNYAYGSSANFLVDTIAPTVSIGSDYSQSELFTLTPSVSGAFSQQWTVSVGNAADVTFTSPTSPATAIQAAVAGSYTLRLTATDSAGNTAYDEMVLTWTRPSHKIFITSTSYNGDLGWLYGADAKCAARAAAAGLNETYIALMSIWGMDAKNRISITTPVYNTAGIKVADNGTDLWDGTLDNSVNVNEFGNALSTTLIWTGALSPGTGSSDKCYDWTTSSSGYQGSYGQSNMTDANWINAGSSTCDVARSIYCITDHTKLTGLTGMTGTSTGTVDLTFKLPYSLINWSTIEIRRTTGNTAPACGAGTVVKTWSGSFTVGGKLAYIDTGAAGVTYSYRACVKNSVGAAIASYKAQNIVGGDGRHFLFLTSTQYNGNLGGLTGADAKCAAAATAAGLTGTYQALLSTSSTDAQSRQTITTPVYNLAGTQLATNGTDLWDGSLAAGVNVNEYGYVNPDASVWSGSTINGIKSAGNMCSDWTDGTDSSNGYHGSSSWASSWFNDYIATCSNKLYLYCLSQ